MKRDTRSAYRARGKAIHSTIDAAVAQVDMEAEDYRRAAAMIAHADRAFEGTVTHSSFDGKIPGEVAIRDQFGWRMVLKVNTRSVTVPSLIKRGWTDTVRFEKIRELREVQS